MKIYFYKNLNNCFYVILDNKKYIYYKEEKFLILLIEFYIV